MSTDLAPVILTFNEMQIPGRRDDVIVPRCVRTNFDEAGGGHNFYVTFPKRVPNSNGSSGGGDSTCQNFCRSVVGIMNKCDAEANSKSGAFDYGTLSFYDYRQPARWS